MKSFITNPWFIGIAASVIAGLFLYYVIGIGRKPGSKQKIKEAAESIDKFGRQLIKEFGTESKDQRHFNEEGMNENQKNSIKRMLDLKIITFKSINKGNGFEYAYHWTKFGDKVIQYLNKIE